MYMYIFMCVYTCIYIYVYRRICLFGREVSCSGEGITLDPPTQALA